MRKCFVWFAFVAALAIAPQTLAAAEVSSDQQLVAIVRQALAAAPTNFVAFQGATLASNGSEIDYKPSPSFAKLCSSCAAEGVADLFATASDNERWIAEFKWNVDKSWTQSRLLAYVRSTFAPLVPGASLSQGSNKDGSSWFEWDTGKTPILYVATYVDSKGQRGILVSVGHFLAQNAHVVRFSRGLTSEDRDALVTAVRNYVMLAVGNAGTDFLPLRGKPSTENLPGDKVDYFPANVSFGDLIERCNIAGILYSASDAADSSHWVFGCSTKAIGGAKAAALSVVHDAVVAALPNRFTLTTASPQSALRNYRWDSNSDQQMVSIDTIDDNDGTTFLLNVFHFIPNR